MSMPRRQRRSLGSVLLALSLGFNVFMIGWVATQRLAPPAFTKPDPPPEVVAASIAQDLPSSDGKMLRDAVAAKRAELAEARAHYLVAVGEVQQVIGADPLDDEALDRVMVGFRSSRQAERGIFGGIMVDVIKRMSPEGRRAFVESHLGGHR